MEESLAAMESENFFSKWVEMVSECCSIHGYNWYNRFRRKWVKNSLFVFILLVTAGFPAFLWFQIQMFMAESSVTDGIEWATARYVRYPNITICHPKYFSKERLTDLSVDDRLASYMAMMFDVNLMGFTKSKMATNSSLETEFNSLESLLMSKLEQEKLTLLALYTRVALKCIDVIVHCDIHNVILSGDECCDRLFDPRPIFTSMGTCYNTHKTIVENEPLFNRAVRIVANLRSSDTPDLNLHILGSNAVELKGLVFALSAHDHPAARLLFQPQLTRPATVIKIALTFSQTNMSPNLQDGFCESDTESFRNKYDLVYTKQNCRLVRMASSTNTSNCTLLPWVGIQDNFKERVCGPRDVWSMDYLDITQTVGLEHFVQEMETNLDEHVCKHECRRVDYEWKASEGVINYPQLPTDLQPEDLTVFHFYFETLDFAKHELYQASFLDFLSKVGGWFGLVFGASIVSFVEVLGFLVLLCFYACRKTLDFP